MVNILGEGKINKQAIKYGVINIILLYHWAKHKVPCSSHIPSTVQEFINKSQTPVNLYLRSTGQNFSEKVVNLHSTRTFMTVINTSHNFFLVRLSDPTTTKQMIRKRKRVISIVLWMRSVPDIFKRN